MGNIVIYGGGTFSSVRNHLSIAAEAFGETARQIKQLLPQAELKLTKMAHCYSPLRTNEDVMENLQLQLNDLRVKCIIMNAALCDYTGSIGDVKSGSHADRLQSREGNVTMTLVPAEKIISCIREQRPDILVVGFKTTTNDSEEEQARKARRMDVDIVIANDTVTRNNILVTSHMIFTSSRKEVINRMCCIVEDELDDVIFENKYGYLIRVSDCKKYMSKGEAYRLALDILELEDESLVYSIGWCDKIEGVFNVGKKGA